MGEAWITTVLEFVLQEAKEKIHDHIKKGKKEKKDKGVDMEEDKNLYVLCYDPSP